SKRIAKIAFTGSTPVGSHIMKLAAENIIPSTVELGGKSPNIYFEDIMQAEPTFIEKAAEGLVLGFFNQGEVCTCPSRALVQESIYSAFMEVVLKKVAQIKRGDPLDTAAMVGGQASQPPLHRKAPRCSPVAAWKNSRARSRRAITSSRRCSRATTRCACSRRRSSAR